MYNSDGLTVFNVEVDIDLMQNDSKVIHLDIGQHYEFKVCSRLVVVKFIYTCSIGYKVIITISTHFDVRDSNSLVVTGERWQVLLTGPKASVPCFSMRTQPQTLVSHRPGHSAGPGLLEGPSAGQTAALPTVVYRILL